MGGCHSCSKHRQTIAISLANCDRATQSYALSVPDIQVVIKTRYHNTGPVLMRAVLVLCTGNSCRSIMAEGVINYLGQGRIKAVSAGSRPAGFVHPKSIATLQRHGINGQHLYSKSWDDFRGHAFDTVITVCDQAAGESCPAFFGQYQKLHWSTPDPATASGTDKDIDAAFDQAFCMLRDRIKNELL